MDSIHMDTVFSIRNLKYKDILDIDCMDIPAYKITCIVGESGSGKSTFLKLLNQIISADEGKISYFNTPIEEIGTISLRRQVVMLQQSPIIYKGTIRDNLLIGLTFSELPLVADEVLLNMLQEVNVKKQLDVDSANLSGGEKQRVAIARVMLMEPDVYLLDEPSSALDDETEKFMIEHLVQRIRQRGKTLIMVTHSKKIASQYADHTIEIKKRNEDYLMNEKE